MVNAQNKLDKEAPEIKPFLEGNPFDSLVEVDKTLPTDLFQMIITNERGGAEKETLKEPTKDEEFVLEPFWGEVIYLVLEWNPSFESYLVSESLSSEDDSSVDSSSGHFLFNFFISFFLENFKLKFLLQKKHQ